MPSLIAAAMRKWERDIAAADAGELARKIRDLLWNKMHDLAFALDAAAHGHHRCG